MALSRTARILIAVLLLAAAGFFWINFFQQNDTVDAAPATVPATGPTSGPASLPAGAPAPLVGSQSPSGQAVTAPDTGTPEADVTGQQPAGAAEAPAVGEADTQPNGQAPTAAPVVVDEPPAVVLRDLVVEQLPFLVTEPPQQETQLQEDEAEAVRSVSGSRANINPFSPILVQAPPAPTPVVADTPPASSEPEIVVVNGAPQPSQPSSVATAPTPVVAPAPRAVAPASVRGSELPRPLPSGTLSAVPDILRDARTAPSRSAGPADLGTVAAVLVPSDAAAAELPYASSQAQVTAASAPEPIGPAEPRRAAATGSGSLPLAVGADSLSRYLRDNNVQFTGQVLGPLSVGVFRSNLYPQPVVVLLGQTLPDTDILLSDLRGYEAKFSLGTNTQVLSLDTRR